MKTLIANKRIGKTAKGGELKLPANQARAVVALGLASYKVEAPVPVKREYKRRDMVAETPKTVVAPVKAATPQFTPQYYVPRPFPDNDKA